MPQEAKYLVHDIETIPESELADQWTDREYKSGSNKGQQKFPPIWAHKIVSIAVLRLDDHYRVIDSEVCAGGAAAGDERAMIERWNELVLPNASSQPLALVDFNGRTFDLPVLQCRAFRYGIPMRWYFDKLPDNKGQISSWSKSYRDRYGGRHKDLLELFTNHGSFKIALDKLARLMGLPGKDQMSGVEVYPAWTNGRRSEIDDYCMEDVFQTAFVLMRLTHLEGSSLTVYRNAVDSLVEHIRAMAAHDTFLKSIDMPLLRLDAVESIAA